jgi:hypothetical protein
MTLVDRTAVSLRFFGDDLDPETLTNALGTTPTKSARKGGIWTTPQGTPVTARHGFWLRRVDEVSPGDLEAQFETLFAGMSSDLEIWQDLSQRYHGNVFVGIFLSEYNEMTGLAPKTLTALAQRGLTLELDIYSGSSEEVPT